MRQPTSLALAALFMGAAAFAQPAAVAPSLETQPGPETAGGSVQDVALWVNPADAGASLLFTAYANANAGLVTFGMDGQPLEQELNGSTLSVAVQDGFPLAGSTRTLVVTSNANVNGLVAYRLDPDGADRLLPIGTGTFLTGTAFSTLAPYRSAGSGRFYLFAGTAGGELQQLELTGADGGVTATVVRDFDDVGTGISGMAVDEENAALFVVETGQRLWRYAAEPDGGSTRSQVTSFPGGALSLEVNRLTLYRASNGEGYLIAANTGSNGFSVFERRSQAFVGSFNVGQDGGIDAVERPVALAVTSRPVGPGFPDGLFLAHDGNDSPQNVKLVSWAAVANGFSPPLRIDTRQTADGGTDGGADAGDADAGPVGPPPPPDDFPFEEDSGCSCSSASVPATVLFGLLALVIARRRRQD